MNLSTLFVEGPIWDLEEVALEEETTEELLARVGCASFFSASYDATLN